MASSTLPLYLGRGRGRERRPLSELRYMQSDLNYTWLVWADGDRLLTSRSLCYFLPRLPADEFLQLHRAYVVNRRFIVDVASGADSERVACLTTGEQLPISRRRWSSVRRWLARQVTPVNVIHQE